MQIAAIWSVIRRFWWLGPVVAAGILFALWRGAEGRVDGLKDRLEAERAAHEITLQSVKTLKDGVSKCRDSITALQNDADNRAERAREALAAVKRQATALDRQIGAIAAQKPSDACVTGSAVLEAEGL